VQRLGANSEDLAAAGKGGDFSEEQEEHPAPQRRGVEHARARARARRWAKGAEISGDQALQGTRGAAEWAKGRPGRARAAGPRAEMGGAAPWAKGSLFLGLFLGPLSFVPAGSGRAASRAPCGRCPDFLRRGSQTGDKVQVSSWNTRLGGDCSNFILVGDIEPFFRSWSISGVGSWPW
jgi:hypothetical protein